MKRFGRHLYCVCQFLTVLGAKPPFLVARVAFVAVRNVSGTAAGRQGPLIDDTISRTEVLLDIFLELRYVVYEILELRMIIMMVGVSRTFKFRKA
jgi:hypothetical protein